MSEFDPRREPVRFAPALATLAMTVCAGAMIAGSRAEAVPAGKTKAPPAATKAEKAKADTAKAADAKAKGKASAEKPEPVKVAAKPAKPAKSEPVKAAAAKAAAAKAEPNYGEPQLIKVKVRKGETLEAALRRAEASVEEAKTAAKLAEGQLGEPAKPGQLFQVEIAAREGRVGSGRVHKLSLTPAGEPPLVLLRGPSGKLAAEKRAETKLAKADAKPAKASEAQVSGGSEPVRLVVGEVRGSLYGSARKAGVNGSSIGEIVKVFAAKLDFERDVKAGDKFRLVYDKAEGKLLFAEIKAKGRTTRFHRFAKSDGQVVWLDDEGRSLKGGLLRTPVDGARVSSVFGMRRHPIFGYNRMHQGVDFAASSGTPIMAAGDGVVVKVGRWGGYGNWLQIKHAGGYESGYAHLSRYASGLKVGDKVRQGELVAYVGSTGASTGPHLHHEIWLNGKRVDPKGAKIPAAHGLDGKELVAFKAQRKRVDAVLEGGTELAAKKSKAKVASLRNKQGAA